MSAPDTNTEKQKKNHKPSLIGIKGAIAFGALMMILLAIFVIRNADDEGAGDVVNTNTDTETTVGN